jgi:hypothetical protein
MSELVDISFCGSGGFNPSILSQADSFEIIDGLETKVIKNTVGNFTTYQIDRVAYAAPTISKSVTNNNVEVGSVVASSDYVFTVVEGSEDISSITSSPDVGAITANLIKTVTRTNITSDAPGLADVIEISVNDGIGVSAFSIGLNFQHKFFQGLSKNADLTEAQIEALLDLSGNTGRLAENFSSLFGGKKSYVIPIDGFQYYLHYLVPVGANQISGAKLNDLPFPLVTLGNKTVTNAQGLAVEYVHKRSANRFPGGTLIIDIS